MEFSGRIADLQQRLAGCHDLSVRRMAVVQHLAPRRGERVLEIGCGAGLLLREIALATGPHGLAAGIDISPDQIAAAAVLTENVPAVSLHEGDARALPYPDNVLDAAVAVQVVEYITEPVAVLAEAARVLKRGGRCLVLATNWDSAFWHGPDGALTAEIAGAWDAHAAFPNLPARLGPMLQEAGFGAIRQLPVPIVNPDLHEGTFAYWLARLMVAFAEGNGMAPDRGAAWLEALEAAEASGEFFFSSVPILTMATKS